MATHYENLSTTEFPIVCDECRQAFEDAFGGGRQAAQWAMMDAVSNGYLVDWMWATMPDHTCSGKDTEGGNIGDEVTCVCPDCANAEDE